MRTKPALKNCYLIPRKTYHKSCGLPYHKYFSAQEIYFTEFFPPPVIQGSRWYVEFLLPWYIFKLHEDLSPLHHFPHLGSAITYPWNENQGSSRHTFFQDIWKIADPFILQGPMKHVNPDVMNAFDPTEHAYLGMNYINPNVMNALISCKHAYWSKHQPCSPRSNFFHIHVTSRVHVLGETFTYLNHWLALENVSPGMIWKTMRELTWWTEQWKFQVLNYVGQGSRSPRSNFFHREPTVVEPRTYLDPRYSFLHRESVRNFQCHFANGISLKAKRFSDSRKATPETWSFCNSIFNIYPLFPSLCYTLSSYTLYLIILWNMWYYGYIPYNYSYLILSLYYYRK